MSYIRADKVTPDDGPDGSMDIRVYRERPALDMNLDDEMLDFVLSLINQVNSLSEGEALVVWKEIF